MYVYVYIYVCMYVYVCMCVYMCIYMYVYVYMYIYVSLILLVLDFCHYFKHVFDNVVTEKLLYYFDFKVAYIYILTISVYIGIVVGICLLTCVRIPYI